MSSNERVAKISCKCGGCELTLADEKSTVSFLCGCEDCRQALQWGFKNGGVKPDPLPRLYYMRSDITDVKGRDKMVAVNSVRMAVRQGFIVRTAIPFWGSITQ